MFAGAGSAAPAAGQLRRFSGLHAALCPRPPDCRGTAPRGFLPPVLDPSLLYARGGASDSAFFGHRVRVRWAARTCRHRIADRCKSSHLVESLGRASANASAAVDQKIESNDVASSADGDAEQLEREAASREFQSLGSDAKRAVEELQASMKDLSQKTSGRRTRLLIGDALVHAELGICELEGLVKRRPDGAGREAPKEAHYKLRFLDGTHYESAERVRLSGGALLSRYIGIEGRKLKLDRLAKRGAGFDARKRKARTAAAGLARDIIRRVAARQELRRQPCPADGERQAAFEAAFPWRPTACQAQAFEDVRRDMCERHRPMDRLVCGDVGFGKTEVALRAAFRAVEAGRQVAILAPTTVLARQHYEKMAPVEGAGGGPDVIDRFQRFGIKVALLTSRQSARERAEIIRGLASGEVQVVVGTSSILSSKVAFRSLGLLVCDEEQRFGVEQKERLKRLRHELDVLTMSATPIPRTLSFAFYGKSDVTLIRTPPAGRLDVLTVVGEYNEQEARAALELELGRGGQVFWVVSKVAELAAAVERVRAIAPQARIISAHGRTDRLEECMDDFRNGGADVLVCTSIIESGIDVPSANTIVIASGENFGLASLYQLRGRVGRSTRQAYCYIYVRAGALGRPETRQRLAEIERHTHLGDGYDLAQADLALRGAGNLVGKEQSGHMHDVGQETFARMVREELARMQAAATFAPAERCAVTIAGLAAHLPESYCPAGPDRDAALDLLAAAETAGEVAALAAELAARLGPAPDPAEDLFALERLSRHARSLGITRIEWEPVVVRLGGEARERSSLEKEGGLFNLHAPGMPASAFSLLQRIGRETFPQVSMRHYQQSGTIALGGLGRPLPPHAQVRALEKLLGAVVESVASAGTGGRGSIRS